MSEDFERRLRASLDKHAAQAPRGDGLDELIIAEAVHGATPISPRRRSAKAWVFPLLAAAAVAAVVLSVVGVTTWRPNSSPVAPAQSNSGTQPHQATTPAPRSSDPAPSHLDSTPTRQQAGPVATPTAVGTLPTGERVHGFTAADLTFTSATSGWALGSADCLPNEGTGRCTAIYRTTDGAHWKSVKGAAFNVPGVNDCAAPCVSNIRFANDRIGYAYSPSVLFMTTDGGASWQRQPGYGANALETLDGNVIRLVDRNGLECHAGCTLHVEVAKVGSSQWTTVALPGGAVGRDEVQLARTGSAAYVLFGGFPEGGGNVTTSSLWVSTDDGASWTRHAGDPCPQLGNREVDARAIAASPGGVTVLCAPRTQPRNSFVATSTDGAASFHATAGRLQSGTLLTGDPGTVLVAAGADTALSTDGGASWHTVAALSGRSGGVSFIGFESETVGRAITDNGRRIWTTSDGGAHWTAVDFPA